MASNSNCADHYVLSNNDYNLNLVSHRLNDASGFNSWRRSLTMALEGRNKICFVDGSLPRPPDDNPDLKHWTRNNAVVSSWILNSVSEDIADSLLHIQTAEKMIKNLITRFQQKHHSRVYDVKQKLFGLYQGSMTVSAFYTKLVPIWEETKSIRANLQCTCGNCSCETNKKWNDLFEEDFVMHFLFRLNDSYESVRSNILMMDILPDLEKAYHIVTQQEHQRTLSTQQIPTHQHVALQNSVTSSVPTSVNPSIVAAVVGGNSKPRQRPLCTHCGLYGHTVQKCYKLHGYPPGYKSNNASRPPQFAQQPYKSHSASQGTVAAITTETGIAQPIALPDFSALPAA
ncbi:PREDICTED: uncharacterized protein LOC104799678 [Tarenaya hassleriana]|uniref:uncharacterized protein LOC104799678 n=1 Tax=Tarenaya hassleriana TaxID=28532 RepID=UPI00053C7892|nr:PREDICTED: uncharacterized protein LOC104799678 [Tarenaya hassleriana]